MTMRNILTVALCVAAVGMASAQNAPVTPTFALQADHAGDSKPAYQVVMEANVRVLVRDGITLATDIYRPDAPGKFPAILQRTPYNRANALPRGDARWYAERGYVVVLQDVRGTYDSDGAFYAFRSEADDGYGTDEWLGKQPWFDGSLGTMGGSYVGYTQWAQAVRGSRYLKAMAMTVTTPDIYANWIYADGALHYGFDLPWGGIEMSGHVMQSSNGYDWGSLYNHLPLTTADDTGHHGTPHYRDWLAHPTRDSYWDGISFDNDYDKISVPILSIDGWYDIFLRGDLNDDIRMRKEGKTAEARTGKRLIIGPWAHETGGRIALPVGGIGANPNPIDFGDNAAIDKRLLHLRWFDHWLKGVNNGMSADAPIWIFVMGENVWRSENEWPLARTQYVNYYIQSGGRANSSGGDGVLTAERPNGAATDSFTYNPTDPVPSMGGNVCCSTVPSGPWDQRSVEERKDVLVYTTQAMKEPTEITGPIKMELFAATSARDTDWTAKLVDVQPNGYAQNIQSGIVRARYREGSGKPAQMIEPGKVYGYTLDLWATSYVILPGHKLRLEVSSSDFPRFDRNLNTGEDPATGTEMTAAKQTIYHSARYPSHVVLPLIPQETGK
jgi:putative CocE/NonD family hydrolase